MKHNLAECGFEGRFVHFDEKRRSQNQAFVYTLAYHHRIHRIHPKRKLAIIGYFWPKIGKKNTMNTLYQISVFTPKPRQH